MELLIRRERSDGGATLGRFYVDGVARYHSLEDEIREVPGQPVAKWKIKGRTAIPAGRYRVVLSYSPKFKRVLPEILNVPGFTGIRIHRGNTAKDTEGCPIVGMTRGTRAWVGSSTPAELDLIARIKVARGDIWITIENPKGEDDAGIDRGEGARGGAADSGDGAGGRGDGGADEAAAEGGDRPVRS